MTIHLTSAAIGIGAFILFIVFAVLILAVILLWKEHVKGPCILESTDEGFKEIKIDPYAMKEEIKQAKETIGHLERSLEFSSSDCKEEKKYREYFRERYEKEERKTLMLCMVVMLIQGKKEEA